MTIVYTMNKMYPGTVGNARTAAYVDTVYSLL